MVRINLHTEYPKYSSCTRFLLPALGIPKFRIPYEILKEMGFINLFLDDYSSGKRHYNRNAGLMLFNPSISFVEDGKFEEVITYFKQRPNFIECVDYGYYIYGVWLIFKYEGLRNLYKKGLFSKFPKAYYIYLDKFELDVCTKNKNWQSTLEKRLGLEDGDLEEVELASKPDIEDFVFDLRKFVKNETV